MPATAFQRFGANCLGIAKQVYGACFPNHLFGLRQRVWRKRWSNSSFSPVWESEGRVPAEIVASIEEDYFPAGSRLLDIGCGSGWITTWLASRGYRAMGVDYAPAAIERARTQSPERPGELEWRVLDILNDDPPRTDFDVLLDRGCLHRIPRRLWPQYARRVRACAKPGAKFWLIVATFDRGGLAMLDSRMTHDEIKRKVGHTFTPIFEIERQEDTGIDLQDGARMDAVAFWMTAAG